MNHDDGLTESEKQTTAPEVKYERASNGGWKLPDSETWEERDRVQQRLRQKQAPTPRSLPLTELEAILADHIDLLDGLGIDLADAHHRDPARVTRIATDIARSARNGTLTSPGGLLRTKLRNVQ